MKPEEFKALTARIAQNLNNQALVTELLTQVNDTYTQGFQNTENLTEQVGSFQEKIKDLQATNMNLFLKVAQPTPDKAINNTEPLSYDKLIQDLGGVK